MDTNNHDAFVQVMADQATATAPLKQPKKRTWLKILAGVVGVVAVLAVILGIAGFSVYKKVYALKGSADQLKTVGKEVYDAIKTQNLPLADQKLQETKAALDNLNAQYKAIGFWGGLPVIKGYYTDGGHAIAAGYAGLDAGQTLLKAVEPYADVLGFKGQGTFTGGSAEERIVKIIETLGKVTPSIDTVLKDLDTVQSELAQIDEKKYPEEFRGIKIRELLTQAKSGTTGAVDIITQAKPMIQVLPDLAGGTTRKKYLVLFQNSGELRPTGGFMTGYAILNVDKGKVEPEASGDIYELDKQFKKNPPIPAILAKYLTTEHKWNLRDMNLSPDFKVSMDTFYANYEKVPGQPNNIDGIIAVDTHFLESLVKVLGPVDVPGYGTFSADNDARCDCPQIIYALSEIVDRPTNYIRENRKGILGPMMKAILTKSYGAPKQLWPQLFTTGWQSLQAKHIQMEFFNQQEQQASEAVGAAGRIVDTPVGSDYFTLVDANLAGAKSNFFITTTLDHEIDLPTNGVLTHKVTVTYKNPFKPSNCNLEAGQLCLNGKLNDWVRVYLPLGAKLVDSQGFDAGSVKQSQDLGHEVIEGVFQLQPLSQAKIQLTYSIPWTNGKSYTTMLQKQGGTEDIKETFTVNGESHDVILDKDQKLTVNF